MTARAESQVAGRERSKIDHFGFQLGKPFECSLSDSFTVQPTPILSLPLSLPLSTIFPPAHPVAVGTASSSSRKEQPGPLRLPLAQAPPRAPAVQFGVGGIEVDWT